MERNGCVIRRIFGEHIVCVSFQFLDLDMDKMVYKCVLCVYSVCVAYSVCNIYAVI